MRRQSPFPDAVGLTEVPGVIDFRQGGGVLSDGAGFRIAVGRKRPRSSYAARCRASRHPGHPRTGNLPGMATPITGSGA